jgi:hypothetical protein
MPLSGFHFEASADRYKRRDPELHEELKRKFAAPASELIADARSRVGMTAEAVLVDDHGQATSRGRAVTETIVRANARPVLLIRDNKVTTDFLGPDSQVWAKRISDAGSLLNKAIPSVGRVELKNNPDYQWVGTGWMVASDIIATNRHVAREFARLGPEGFTFRLGLNGAPQAARLDFLEEFERSAKLEFQVDSILWIASPNGPDIAFLRMRRSTGDGPLPPSISLAEDVALDDFVVTIGYPARDPRVPDQDMVRRIFGDVYEKKRLAPGQIMNVTEEELEHDCSTLGGNSGSAVVSLATGAAVGLHFSGLFLQANFAVPAPKIHDLLLQAQKGELPGMAPVRISSDTNVTKGSLPGVFTFQLQIPLDVTVKVGSPLLSSAGGNLPPAIAVNLPAPGPGGNFDAALTAARQALSTLPDVLDIHLGYRFKNGWITDERVIVVEVGKKLSPTELRSADKPQVPAQIMGVATDVRTAGLPEQLEALGIDVSELEAPAKAGLYREPPDLTLEPVRDENVEAIFHVSPDSGFPNLKAFLERVEKHLTATIYEWEPKHISDAIESAMRGSDRILRMVTQPHHGIAEGTEDAVEDMQKRIGKKFKHVYASVGAGKLIPSAYHIKVASRDGEEFWLSSGNWKDSNQADIDPAGEHSHALAPLQQHNREWHAVIKNRQLAVLFQKYIEFDFEEAQRVPFEEIPMPSLPDVFVPEAAFLISEAPVSVHYFEPLKLHRPISEIQPLLTPDRNARHQHIFITFATKMAAAATKRIYVQNQSFSINEDLDEYEQFFATLRDKQKAGLDVRIIFRDPREFPHGAQTLQKTLEKIKTFELDTDFVKVQRKCHTKGIIVDSEQVILGSQNLTSAGSLFNRDASLLVRDPEVAAYFEQIFVFDWEQLAVQKADELVGGIRLAQPGESTPVGFRRVSVSELLGAD